VKASAAPAIHFRQPNVTILERCVSTSGKYLLFLGFHYEAGVTCWVVGSSSKGNPPEIVMRHYNEKIPNCVAPKAMAQTYWEKFKIVMTAKRESEDEQEEEFTQIRQALEKLNPRNPRIIRTN
jgi:hypothetical protein